MNESPEHQTSPSPAPIEPPVPPVTPPVVNQQPQPNGQPPHDNTDVLGIISIVMVFIGLHVVGFVLGLVGASKAKREQRSPVLSRVGWIVNLVGMILFVIGLTLFILLIALAENDKSSTGNLDSSTGSSSEVSASTRKVSSEGFSLIVPKEFQDIPIEYRSTAANYTQGDDAKNEYTLVIKESASDFRSTMTVQDYADLINKSYSDGESLTNATVSSLSGVLNPGLLDSVDYQVIGDADDVRVVYYVRYVKTATSFYQVLTWTTPSSVADTKDDLYSILESFREE